MKSCFRSSIARSHRAAKARVHRLACHRLTLGLRFTVPAAIPTIRVGQRSLPTRTRDPASPTRRSWTPTTTAWLTRIGFSLKSSTAARRLSVPATVTYFSDHGEDLYALDGMSGHGAAVYSKHQFDIPAFVWMNAAYRAGSCGQGASARTKRRQGDSQPQRLLFGSRSHGHPLAGAEARRIFCFGGFRPGRGHAAARRRRRHLSRSIATGIRGLAHLKKARIVA